MLAKWTEILPLFVVRWLALRKCERFVLARGAVVAGARPDVLFYIKGDPNSATLSSHSQGTEK